MTATRIIVLLLVFIIVCFSVCSIEAGGIEAVAGKRYALSRQNGPWMIMVATFKEPPPEMKVEGKTPDVAADELVFELRSIGLPAYSFVRDASTKEIETTDHLGRETNKKFKLDKEICVIAGNYTSIDPEATSPDDAKHGKTAQDSLKYVKSLKPKCLDEGGIYRQTPGQPGPLAGAFLTINPLLSPEDVQARKKDPVILELNSGMDYSLFDNPGNCTLIIATFSGKSITKSSDADYTKAFSLFKVSDSLDVAYHDAWKLTQSLRNQGIEAYVYHDRFKSYVTVGAFESREDPAIRPVWERYHAKPHQDPQSGQTGYTAEYSIIPDHNGNDKMIVFDPDPQVMRVPKYR